MKIITALSILLATASGTTISYDSSYDDENRSLSGVSCSDGVNGLMTKYEWTTIGNIPKAKYVGGSSDIAGWNSEMCGQCYQVNYEGRSIYVLGIDRAGSGLNLSKGAMDDLTQGQAEELGSVQAAVTKVGVSRCGLTPAWDGGVEFNA